MSTSPPASTVFTLRSLIPSSPKADILSGVTVALALVPEAIAFAFVAGVDPVMGLISAVIIGLVTSIAGGRPGMISGATGAMAVVVVGLVAKYGVGYLFYAVVLCGILQILVGILRLGKLIRMVPHPVMLGFVNGLAIVIGMAQLGSFKALNSDGVMAWLDPTRLGIMIGLVLVTMGIVHQLPRFTKAVPSSLAAIIVVSLMAIGINSYTGGEQKMVLTVKDFLANGSQAQAVKDAARSSLTDRTKAAKQVLEDEGLLGGGFHLPEGAIDPHTLGEVVAELPDEQRQAALASIDPEQVSLQGGLPIPFFTDERYKELLPPLNAATLAIIFPVALILAGVGLIESLMTLSLIDEITETRGRGNRECVGQGVANIACGLLGGMGGCAMIGQSLINVKSGGRGRLAGITAAIGLLLFVLFLAPFVEMIPMAALVGVMFMVVIGTFEWTTLKTWNKVPKSDVFIMVFVAGYTVFKHDLATAVILGVVISALVFAWKKSTHLMAEVITDDESADKVYQLHGPLFFGSSGDFKTLFDIENDPDDVAIDFYFSRVYDQSAIEAINFVAEKYAANKKTVHLRHLSEECQALLGRAGDLVEANISEDPHYHVATDRLA